MDLCFAWIYDTSGGATSDVIKKMQQPQHSPKLVGIGLDGDDGHVRVTKGENFHLMGGSSDTHEQMQEKCIKFNEKLEDRGKRLEQLEKNEFIDIAAECDMNVLALEKPDDLPPRR